MFQHQVSRSIAPVPAVAMREIVLGSVRSAAPAAPVSLTGAQQNELLVLAQLLRDGVAGQSLDQGLPFFVSF